MILPESGRQLQLPGSGHQDDTKPADSQDVIDEFLENNQLDHITQLMSHHKQYLEPFLKTHYYLLRGDGPLRFDYRHYIAIMAASRHQCVHLVNIQEQEFLKSGGNEQWLLGLDHIPQKLRDLCDINKILAHRPWQLKRSHIEKLTQGKDNWSLAEVVHAIVLLAHFHTLASFVYGCGSAVETDGFVDHDHDDHEVESNGTAECVTDSMEMDVERVEMLVKKIQNILEHQNDEPTEEARLKEFKCVEYQAFELAAEIDVTVSPNPALMKYVDDPKFMYKDFSRRPDALDISTFLIQDYSWDTHGYSLVNRLYNEVGQLLDEKFKIAYNLTYRTMGVKRDVDTFVFRRAIWNYIQCMYGIRHDDYDYREITELLERNFTTYIKIVCCYAGCEIRKEFASIMRELRPSERVHVNLVIMEARLQAQLLYALRAIMRYLT